MRHGHFDALSGQFIPSRAMTTQRNRTTPRTRAHTTVCDTLAMRVRAKAVRSGTWWAIEVPPVRGLHTQARTLSEAPAAVIEAGLALGVKITSVVVAKAPGR